MGEFHGGDLFEVGLQGGHISLDQRLHGRVHAAADPERDLTHGLAGRHLFLGFQRGGLHRVQHFGHERGVDVR
jgi:hypothetical protein